MQSNCLRVQVAVKMFKVGQKDHFLWLWPNCFLIESFRVSLVDILGIGLLLSVEDMFVYLGKLFTICSYLVSIAWVD